MLDPEITQRVMIDHFHSRQPQQPRFVLHLPFQFSRRRHSPAVAVQPYCDHQLRRPRRSPHFSSPASNRSFVPAYIQSLDYFPDSSRRMMLLDQVFHIDLRHGQLRPIHQLYFAFPSWLGWPHTSSLLGQIQQFFLLFRHYCSGVFHLACRYLVPYFFTASKGELYIYTRESSRCRLGHLPIFDRLVPFSSSEPLLLGPHCAPPTDGSDTEKPGIED